MAHTESSLSPDERNIHFVSDTTRDTDPALALFCLAPASEILSAMESMVHQRCAWGIEDPLVGLLVEPVSFAGQVIVAWPGDDPTGAVNFASGSIFHLDAPADTLRLFRFLLRLSCDQLHRCGEIAVDNVPRVRSQVSAGTIDLWRTGDEHSSYQDRIYAWLNEASKSGCPDFSRSPTDSHSLSPPSTNYSMAGGRLTRSKSGVGQIESVECVSRRAFRGEQLCSLQ
ncbi:hypothetical protein FA95DRAFT_73075 [Auriscalpium vulgare]|uniref:Uncharacterized protein n=1 Tax=Auriscalpium vulgare TaxID=40419 RepID=A0ACB8RP03_9AGAM|nr:hypothetical protein FA95DRAFT_73075 [Auriscalpium vulgare]